MLFLFGSSRAAIKADLLCDKYSIKRKIVTTPEYISNECGMSLEIEEEYIEKACSTFDKETLEYKIYDRLTKV